MFRLIAPMGRRGVVCLVLVIAPACDDSGAKMRMMPEEGKETAILRQIQGPHSHETTAMRLVIRDEAAWAQVHLAETPVDFEREMLLVVTLGTVMSDQYAVRIERVWRDGHRLKVATRIVKPPIDASLEPAAPFCIAVVPRCDLNVEGFSPIVPLRERPWIQSPPRQLRE